MRDDPLGSLCKAGPTFERITGRKAKGEPVWLSVGLVARDRNGQTLELEYGLFVDVPFEIMRKGIRASLEKRRPKPKEDGPDK